MTARKTSTESPVSDPEIRVLQLLINTAALQVQELLILIAIGEHNKTQARATLKACELAEAAIVKAKTPLRRIIRRKT